MRLSLLFSVLLAASCGSTEGSPCSTPNAVECAGAKTLLVCEGTKWTGYPCPSCSGGKCDWKGAATGDACPKVAETYGTCAFDGRVVGCFWSTTADAGVFVESACAACVAGKSMEELGRCGSGRCTCQ
jgi:hypothetical protein